MAIKKKRKFQSDRLLPPSEKKRLDTQPEPDGLANTEHSGRLVGRKFSGKCEETLFPLGFVNQQKRYHELQVYQLELEIQNIELSKTRDELEAAIVELEAFNSTVSHDLRQPLMLISCYAQNLQELCDAQTDERFGKYLREIHENTMQMSRRIASLLSFSRTAHWELRREEINLSAVAKTLATELKLMTPERQVSFNIPEGIRVNADPELCRLVLENLIGNAWKFTGDQVEGVIEFGTTRNDGEPVFFVKDNGRGFSKTDGEALFKPFQRLTETKVEGYGIGLATVARVIQRHGGRVWAESALGKGATFFFTLESTERSLP